MFRDSRGAVHTVSAANPLEDIPPAASEALARTLLVPSQGDLGSLLERTDAVIDLLERWQDDFFAALPADVDLEEEARWAERAGISLADVEQEWGDEEDEYDGSDDTEEPVATLPLIQADLPSKLPEQLLTELETSLVLLPMRTRLEALVAATTLVHSWCDLMVDHEKCLGHLVLVHGERPEAAPHEVLVDRHACLHGGQAVH